MIVVQTGAALAQPTMAAYGPIATTWGRLAWAAIILGLFVRPDIRRYRRQDLLLAAALGATMALMTLTFYVAIMRVPLGLVAAIPAVVIYNQLVRTITGYRAALGDASAQILLLISREQAAPSLRLARAAE